MGKQKRKKDKQMKKNKKEEEEKNESEGSGNRTMVVLETFTPSTNHPFRDLFVGLKVSLGRSSEIKTKRDQRAP